jgi:hypothetical protein
MQVPVLEINPNCPGRAGPWKIAEDEVLKRCCTTSAYKDTRGKKGSNTLLLTHKLFNFEMAQRCSDYVHRSVLQIAGRLATKSMTAFLGGESIPSTRNSWTEMEIGMVVQLFLDRVRADPRGVSRNGAMLRSISTALGIAIADRIRGLGIQRSAQDVERKLLYLSRYYSPRGAGLYFDETTQSWVYRHPERKRRN